MLKVAARLKVQAFPRVRSRWTTDALPFSNPMAVAGYQGSTSMEMRLGISTVLLSLAFAFLVGTRQLFEGQKPKAQEQKQKPILTIHSREGPRSKFPMSYVACL